MRKCRAGALGLLAALAPAAVWAGEARAPAEACDFFQAQLIGALCGRTAFVGLASRATNSSATSRRHCRRTASAAGVEEPWSSTGTNARPTKARFWLSRRGADFDSTSAAKRFNTTMTTRAILRA